MKQSSNSRRSRGRGVGKRQPKNSNFDSNGPEVRVRGSAQQVYEKYLTLARDALAVDDRIASENYFQHAEHYFRILGAQESGENRDGGREGGRDNNRDNNRDGGRNRRGRGPQQSNIQPEEIGEDGAGPAPVPAEQPAPEQTPESAPEPEQTEATVERTGATAEAAADGDSDTDNASGDDDEPLGGSAVA